LRVCACPWEGARLHKGVRELSAGFLLSRTPEGSSGGWCARAGPRGPGTQSRIERRFSSRVRLFEVNSFDRVEASCFYMFLVKLSLLANS
jgi:hypothetical protein